MGVHGDVFPAIAALPSFEMTLGGPDPDPTLMDVLGPFLEENRDVLECPSDYKPPTERRPRASTYFLEEGQSYEYRNRPLANKSRPELTISRRIKLSEVLVMYDYDNFHGPDGQLGSRNALFADMHVEAY